MSAPGLIGACSFNGLAWGPTSEVHTAAITGLDDLPEVRTSDVPRPGRHGSWKGRDLLGPRLIDMDLSVIGVSTADFFAQLALVESALLVSDDELPLLLFDQTQLVKVRCRRRAVEYAADQAQRTGLVHVRFEATDPLRYSAALHTAATGLGTATGGLVFPATFPATFGSGSAGGQVSVVNAGNFATAPLLTITGPVDNPIVDHVELGRSLQFALSLVTGDSLVLDADARTAVLNGTANREQSLTLPQWFLLPAGTSTVRYRNNGAFTASTLTVAWRDASL